jgi:hypothetical protein
MKGRTAKLFSTGAFRREAFGSIFTNLRLGAYLLWKELCAIQSIL